MMKLICMQKSDDIRGERGLKKAKKIVTSFMDDLYVL